MSCGKWVYPAALYPCPSSEYSTCSEAQCKGRREDVYSLEAPGKIVLPRAELMQQRPGRLLEEVPPQPR